MTLCSPWLTIQDMGNCDCPGEATPSIVESAIEIASSVLYGLSGRIYPGVCSEIVRPSTSPSSGYSPWPYPWMPLQISPGVWINIGFCGCELDSCGCPGIPRIDLARLDVQSVETVWVAGAVLDPSAYRLDHSRYLSRIDGSPWPCCQDLRADLTEVNTYGAQITYGTLPDAAGLHAAKAYTTEIYKACIGAGCRLPRRAVNIVRDGVSIDFLDPMEFLADGRTGLYEVDVWLSSVNPNGLRSPAVVYSPDIGTCDLRYPVSLIS